MGTTSVTQTTIALAWDAYPGATAYQVLRNGMLISTPTGTTFPTREQNSISGSIAFVGVPSATPSSWGLASGSTGKIAASDGTDMGVNSANLLTVN